MTKSSGVGGPKVTIQRADGGDTAAVRTKLDSGLQSRAKLILEGPPPPKGAIGTGELTPTGSTKGPSPLLGIRTAAPYEDLAIAKLFPSSIDVIPPQFRIVPADHPARYQIGNRVVTETDPSRMLPVYSKIAMRGLNGVLEPILLGHTPKIGAAEATEAVKAAESAWAGGHGAWPTATSEQRIAAVESFAKQLEADTEAIAKLLMYEIGKPYAAAKSEVVRSIDYIKATVSDLREMEAADGQVYTGLDGKETSYARNLREPLGVTLCVAPFNYPINEFLTTIIPALLMGNVVVAKTPRFGVLANQALMDSFAKSFPDGVVSLLPGDGKDVIPSVIGASEPDALGKPRGKIDVLAFIGSEGAAKAISAAHPDDNFLTKILGLGAKNAAVVLPGADLDEVAAKLVKGALGNNGQRCTAEKIIWAPEGPEGDLLVAKLAEKVAALKVGMPWEPDVAVTPLPEDDKVKTMWEYLDDAVSKGARIVNAKGGTAYHSLMRPAVVDGVRPGMRLYHEEQFGPILAVARYKAPSDVVRWQQESPFGQQAGVWGPKSPERDAIVRSFLREVSRVNVNANCKRSPDTFGFSATEKSGFGTLSIREALKSFSRVSMQVSPEPDAV